ncbi:winged helix-turn-helix transcriptional regulator [Streptomyces sp. ISL-96]|uniref:winged helix-turn-helix domain-containing protein n=1 Tax=Streptomyces sp. ISL-96 TaxID=2819191 RepID=UPI001BE84CC3|nr:winged helix-turn-helix domain-containing protein [Streptomyces sp. ISL-96]MBT2492305.1 winged helix-turn-helix transcriptional regulator [Streptomyces sp. ISL-96]
MLRIHFTTEDLNRLRVAAQPDPLWEIVNSLHLLQNRQGALVFDPWRREVRAAIARAGLTGTVASLHRLCPCAAYIPDFLTPGRGIPDLETGVDQVLSTPVARMSAELGRLFADGPVPPVARRLAEGDVETLERLGDALRRYYAVAVEPYLDVIRAAVDADRPVRAEAALSRGPEGLLSSYQDFAWRDDGVLETGYPVDSELELRGRSLTMIPSFFCIRHPVSLADPELPPVLVHPVTPDPGWLALSRPDGAGGPGPKRAGLPVAQLIGHTRAYVLEVLERPMTTTQLGGVLRLTLSTASRHATVLREAGLVASERRGSHVLHRRTPLGDAIMNGAAYGP